jgi:hypothetical protein
MNTVMFLCSVSLERRGCFVSALHKSLTLMIRLTASTALRWCWGDKMDTKRQKKTPFRALEGCKKVLRLEHLDTLKATGNLKLVFFF